MAQEGEMAVPTMWRLINLLASIEPKQHANGHRRDACAPLPRRKILQSTLKLLYRSTKSHRQQKAMQPRRDREHSGLSIDPLRMFSARKSRPISKQ